MKKKIRRIDDHAELFIDSKTGIATVVDWSSGISYSVHPNIDATGSVKGMRDRGYWDKKDKVVRANGAYYNTSRVVVDENNKYEVVCKEECRCESCLQRKIGKESAR